MKKILSLFLIFIFILNSTAFADESLDLEGIDDYASFQASSNSTNEPITNSKNIVVLDRKTLSVLYEKNAYEKVAMASTTKIMTCIIILENCSLDDIVTVSKKATSVHGSTLGLVTDMKISVLDLLYGLMLRSGNDCAISLAEHLSGTVENFSVLMNQKAKELGLNNTNFVTPHGLDDENHYTTAYELAILTDYALKNEQFRNIVSTKTHTISFNGGNRTISNTNELLGNLEGIYGVKTGFTFEAGRCLVSACKRDSLDIIVVVLGANTKSIRTKDSASLINYILNTYNYIDVSSTINDSFNQYLPLFEKNCLLKKTRTSPILKLQQLENYKFPLPINDALELNTKIYTVSSMSPSTNQGSKIGTLELYNGNSLLCTADITLDNELIKNSSLYYFNLIIRNLFVF